MIEGRGKLVVDLESLLAEAGIEHAAEEATQILQAALRQGNPIEGANRALKMAYERAMGTPLAYLTGRAPFMGVDVQVAPGALIPRAETELLGTTALRILKGMSTTRPHVIDMCCGAGNLTCGIASAHPGATFWAADLVQSAVDVAGANVRRLGLSDRATVFQGDLFGPLADRGLEGRMDMVVCNPPYISTGKLEKDRAELLNHEPREAFDGGPYGISIFQRVVRESLHFLKPGGYLLFEIGVGQARQVTLLFDRTGAYEPVETVTDDAGETRVILGRKK